MANVPGGYDQSPIDWSKRAQLTDERQSADTRVFSEAAAAVVAAAVAVGVVAGIVWQSPRFPLQTALT